MTYDLEGLKLDCLRDYIINLNLNLKYKMPYKVTRKPNGKYKVINKDTGRVVAKNTTRERATKQIRLLHFIDATKNVRKKK